MNKPTTVTVNLSQPIKRENGKDVESITLRKPNTGELRGLKMLDVMQLDINALSTLLPRISQPNITKDEFDTLTLPDMTDLGVAILDFFDRSPTPTG